MITGSVGTVTTQYYDHQSLFAPENGETLPSVTITSETYGTLNQDATNAVHVPCPLQGRHVAGDHEEEKRVGWGTQLSVRARLSTLNDILSSVFMFSAAAKVQPAPRPKNPVTGIPYGATFPFITVKDMINSQKLLIDHLGINRLYVVAGGSMGGKQVLHWAVCYQNLGKKGIVIATSGYSTLQQIAFNGVGRQAIVSDPEWNDRNYYNSMSFNSHGPVRGLSLARMIGLITSDAFSMLIRRTGS